MTLAYAGKEASFGPEFRSRRVIENVRGIDDDEPGRKVRRQSVPVITVWHREYYSIVASEVGAPIRHPLHTGLFRPIVDQRIVVADVRPFCPRRFGKNPGGRISGVGNIGKIADSAEQNPESRQIAASTITQ